jgi:hypothetical protein
MDDPHSKERLKQLNQVLAGVVLVGLVCHLMNVKYFLSLVSLTDPHD